MWCHGSRDNGVRYRPEPIRRFALAAGGRPKRPLLGFRVSWPAKLIHLSARARSRLPDRGISVSTPAAACATAIYAVRGCRRTQVRWRGELPVRRPMFDNGAALLETYLFDFAGRHYGRSIDVAFIDWIREEQVLDSVEHLVRQMQDDSRRARAALARSATRSRRFSRT